LIFRPKYFFGETFTIHAGNEKLREQIESGLMAEEIRNSWQTDLEKFKKFTFWSEHLVLHNRFSLAAFLDSANFKNTVISGFQRYNLANHLHWLKEKKPRLWKPPPLLLLREREVRCWI